MTSHGFIEPGAVYFQVKAMETLSEIGSDYVFDLDVRECNLWIREEVPVILILFDATRKRAYWLAIQRYFAEESWRHPKKGTKTVRVRVPKRQRVNRLAIAKWRDLK